MLDPMLKYLEAMEERQGVTLVSKEWKKTVDKRNLGPSPSERGPSFVLPEK
jgi:hypothetical protein